MTEFEEQQLKQLKLINAQLNPGAVFMKPALIALLVLLYAVVLGRCAAYYRGEGLKPHQVLKGSPERPLSHPRLVPSKEDLSEKKE